MAHHSVRPCAKGWWLASINLGPKAPYPHAHFALGYGGNGITFSVIAAKIIRDCFLGCANSDVHLLRYGR